VASTASAALNEEPAGNPHAPDRPVMNLRTEPRPCRRGFHCKCTPQQASRQQMMPLRLGTKSSPANASSPQVTSGCQRTKPEHRRPVFLNSSSKKSCHCRSSF
jgi:hypothetical protein